MIRLAAILGMIMGAALIALTVNTYLAQANEARLLLGVGIGVLLAILGMRILRGHHPALVPVGLLGLAVLARVLPAYFREPAWTTLGLVLLSMLTFGFSVLAFLLYRFEVGRAKTAANPRL